MLKNPKINFQSLKMFPQVSGKDIICLNLSSDILKLAHAKVFPKKREIVSLSSCGIQGLPELEVSKIIRTSLDNLKLKDPEVINIISAHSTITRNIEIPSQDPNEIKEIINLQAGRHTPYSREEIIIDYINLGTHKKHYTKILLIIVTLSIVRRQIEILDAAGLKTENVFFAPEAISQVYANNPKLNLESHVFTLMHIDTNFTDFIITSNGKLIFTRSIPIGSQQLINEKDRYEIRFVEEAKRSIEAYANEHIDKESEKFILTGAAEDNPDIKDMLVERLGAPISFSPYFKNINISDSAFRDATANKGISFLDVISPLITTGHIETNFIPEEIKLRKQFVEKSQDLVKIGILAMVLLAFFAGILISKIYFKNFYLSNLAKKYKSVSEEAKGLESNFSRIEAVKNYLKDRGLSLEILTELYNLIPVDMRIKDVRLSAEGKFTLSGNARTMSTVFSFISNMQESKYFNKVETRRTTKRKEADEELVDFEIVCNISQQALKVKK
jgi:Tfp pilus assembly PilM family ATPase/Tfp pilus assembly protein PilN